MAPAPDILIIKLDPEDRAILERLALALEALVKQQQLASPQPAPPRIGPFLGEE